MKYPITRHKEANKYGTLNHNKLLDESLSTIIALAHNKNRIDFRRMQVDAAEKQGKDGFDPERFMKGKKAVGINTELHNAISELADLLIIKP